MTGDTSRRGLMIGENRVGYEHPSRLGGEASARREVTKLKLAIQRASKRKDKKAEAYLAKRLAAAQAAVRQAGWQDMDYDHE